MPNYPCKWCETADIDLEQIEELAFYMYKHGCDVSAAYLSANLYYNLINKLSDNVLHVPSFDTNLGLNSLRVYTAVGEIAFKIISKYDNFCHVGTEDTLQLAYKQREWIEINKAFEENVLGES